MSFRSSEGKSFPRPATPAEGGRWGIAKLAGVGPTGVCSPERKFPGLEMLVSITELRGVALPDTVVE